MTERFRLCPYDTKHLDENRKKLVKILDVLFT